MTACDRGHLEIIQYLLENQIITCKDLRCDTNRVIQIT